jgi:hypothetical protein
MRVLVISPQAGMGNRLQAMASALVLGKLLDRRVYHSWVPEVDERLSHLSNVKDMQRLRFEDLFEKGKIPRWTGKTDVCFSEWLPGQFWFSQQSSSYHRLMGGTGEIRQIYQDAGELASCSADVILLETSHVITLSTRQAEWSKLMSQVYHTHFQPIQKYLGFIGEKRDIGVSIRRGELYRQYPEARQDLEEVESWLRKKGEQTTLHIFSDEVAVQDRFRTLFGLNTVMPMESLKDWERGYVQFLTLALQCNHIYGTPKSSFAIQASIFGDVPYVELLEPVQSRTLIIYVYYERPTSKEAFKMFVSKAMLQREHNDYWLVINGITDIPISDQWDRVIHRPNEGGDFEGWREGLRQVDLTLYDYFLCLNDTVQGPYGVEDWVPRFTSLVTSQCLLSGLTINCCTYQPFICHYNTPVVPHVQSMLWCTNRKGLKVLWKLLMDDSPREKDFLIIRKEMGLSMELLNAGYNITAILPTDQRDYRNRSDWTKYTTENLTSGMGDQWYTGAYYGRSIKPTDTIFFKHNRGLPME